jgi:hypothetical protein
MSLSARIVSTLVLLVWFAAAAAGQMPQDVTTKADALIAAAYQAALVKLPCKLSKGPNSRMLNWKNVDKCMDQARQRVNWDELASRLIALRPSFLPEGDFAGAIENLLVKHALPYNKVFRVGKPDALLPLTNSILKYAIQDELMNMPVLPQKGNQPIGVFSGTFTHEKAGAMATGNTYRLSMFQYTDPQGKMQTPSDKLLLDSYGIRWGDIESKPGFRFPVELIPGIGRR